MRSILIIILAPLLIATLPGCQSSSGPVSQNFEDVSEMIADAKTRINEITIAELDSLQDTEEYFVLIDVRSEKEHDLGYIPGSVLIPRGSLEFKITNEAFWDDEGLYLPEKSDMLILYCRSGKRSTLSTDALQKLGFNNIVSLTGGFNAWKAEYPDDVEVNLPPVTASAPANAVPVEEAAGGC